LGVETTFTVERVERGSLVRFDTVIDDGGVPGMLTRLFALRLMRSLYEDELARLEACARAHPIADAAADGTAASRR
jgi:hypothetical protein